MAGGTISLGKAGQMEGRIVWSSESNGTTANSSSVTATIQVKRTDSYTTKGTWKGALNIGGTTKDFSVYDSVSKSWFTLLSFSITKNHNADGTATCYISGQINGPSGTSQAGKVVYGNETVSLTTIDRQAVLVKAYDFNDSGTPIITYSNPAGEAVTSLQACISLDGSIDDIKYRDISKTGTKYTFTFTDAEKEVLNRATTTSKSRTVYFYVKTVLNGVTYLSRLAKKFTVSGAVPTLSPTVKDVDADMLLLTGDESKFVRYYSNISFNAGVSLKKYATVKSCIVSCGGQSDRVAQQGTFYNVDSNEISFTVTDSRGYTVSETVPLSVIDYVKLTCNMEAEAPTPTGVLNLSVSGNYFNGSFGAKDNTLTIQYRYKASGDDYIDWVTAEVEPIITGNKYTADIVVTGLDYRNTYTIQTRAVDAILTIATLEKKVKTLPVFDWGEEDFNINGSLGFRGVGSVLRVNGDNNNVVLSSPDATNGIFLRPNGTGEAEGQAILDKQGKLSLEALSANTITIGNMEVGTNNILWSGTYYMSSSHTITLKNKISNQISGIVLVFSRYSNGAAEDANFNFFFVPKAQIELQGGTGACFQMSTANFSVACAKYLYINDSTISGNDLNVTTGTGTSGIKYENNAYVLRYVIGV